MIFTIYLLNQNIIVDVFNKLPVLDIEYTKIDWVMKMISYEPFYQTLYRKGLTEYYLIYKQGIPANTLHRMKHGKDISTKTLNTLCFVLQCNVEDILCYIPDKD